MRTLLSESACCNIIWSDFDLIFLCVMKSFEDIINHRLLYAVRNDIAFSNHYKDVFILCFKY